jgi:D-alanyl-D-alanine carboxypeptidase/D-alanyl-D-alanine-endopeptidase (penicillin-binding protein 4)
LLLFALAVQAAVPLLAEKAHGNPDLDQRIDRILAKSDAQRGSWGIQVVELENGKLLYARDADHLFIPASNMKMFTTAAALEKLGPDYVFHTTAESDAAPDAQGRVWNLYLVGRGDPNLGVRTFPYTYHGPQQPAAKFLGELADQVKARGVREVVRNLVADDSYFVWEPFAPNWAADDLDWGYGAPVSALAFNDNLLTLHVKPGEKAGDQAEVRLDPVADYYLLRNHIQTSAKGTKKKYLLERQPGSMDLDLWGQIPIGSGEDVDTVAIANPPLLMAEQFRAARRGEVAPLHGALAALPGIFRFLAGVRHRRHAGPPFLRRRNEREDSRQDRLRGARQHALRLHGPALGKTLGFFNYDEQSSPREQGRPGNTRRDYRGNL